MIASLMVRSGSRAALLSLLLGPTAALSLAGAACAQSRTPLAVTIDAYAYASLDVNAVIAVETDDDSDQSLRLKADIVAALEAHGYRVDKDAPLVLSFYATEPIGLPIIVRPSVEDHAEGPQAGSVGPDEGLLNTAHSNDQYFRTNVISEITDGIFGNTARSDKASPNGRAMHVNIDLNDVRAARRIWQGSAGTVTNRSDSYHVESALVPPLIDVLGANATRKTIDAP
jgi:hypothetical protein